MNVQNATGCSFQQPTGNRPTVLRARYETQVHSVCNVTQLELKIEEKLFDTKLLYDS